MIESETKGKEVESNSNFDETVAQLNEAVCFTYKMYVIVLFLFVF